MHDGLIESTRYLRNPLDVLAQQIVAHLAVGPCSVEDLAALVRRCACFADLTDDLLVNVLDLLAGRYPSEEFGELRPADRVGPRRRAAPGPGRRPAPGRHQRRHHPRPRAVRRVPARRHPGRRAGRGDGLREPPGRDVPARRLHLAHRGHQLRAGGRHARRRASPGKMPFWHGDRPGRPLELGRALGAFVREVREPPAGRGRRAAPRPTTGWTRGRPANVLPLPGRAGGGHRAWCRTIAPWWSSASGTRSATGGSACSARSARRCTRRGPWPSSAA